MNKDISELIANIRTTEWQQTHLFSVYFEPVSTKMKNFIKWKDSDMAEKILYGVKSIKLPQTSAQMNEVILNQTYFMTQTKFDVEQTEIEFRDFAGLPVYRKLKSCFKLSDDLYPDDLKFRIMLNAIHRESGDVTNIVLIENAIMQGISGIEFGHEKSDLAEFSISFRHPPIDWALHEVMNNGIDFSALNGSMLRISLKDIASSLKASLMDFTFSAINKGISSIGKVANTAFGNLMKKIF